MDGMKTMQRWMDRDTSWPGMRSDVRLVLSWRDGGISKVYDCGSVP